MNDALKTYRYLRIGMVGAVLLLAAAIGFERAEVSCWQDSISAYYYTPVRAIFVGTLMAIALGLIVIKGNTAWEDGFLNIAGMLAPVVAVVPTTNVGTCWSIEPNPRPVLPDGSLAPWVVANIDNNIKALLFAGIFALFAALAIATAHRRDLRTVVKAGTPGMRWSLAGAMALLLGAWAAFSWWDDFDTKAHGIAAVAMFVFLALAVASNAWRLKDDPAARGYFWWYAAIAVAMAGSAIVLFAVGDGWQHQVLILEAVEIALFAAFWLVSTAEHWGDEPAAAPAV